MVEIDEIKFLYRLFPRYLCFFFHKGEQNSIELSTLKIRKTEHPIFLRKTHAFYYAQQCDASGGGGGGQQQQPPPAAAATAAASAAAAAEDGGRGKEEGEEDEGELIA